MTAVNVFVLDDCALIVTDSKAVKPTGGSFDAAKCLTLPHLRMALAVQGSIALSASLCRHVALRSSDYDSTRLMLKDSIRELAQIPYGDPAERAAWQSQWSIFIAGWSALGKRPAAFCLANHGKQGQTAWQSVDVDYMAASPFIADAVEAARFDPWGRALALVEAQAKSDPANIGGYVSATAIFADRIEQGCLGKIAEPGARAPMAA